MTAVKTQREVTFPIIQAAHGFTAGQALRYTGSVYAAAQANSAANAEVVGVVDRVLNADTFYLRTTGRIIGLSGLTPGSTYFLSPSVAGALTATEPTTNGQVSRAVLVADSASSGYVYNNHGSTIGAGGGGGGNMATDVLWDVKGDLAVGTGPDTAVRHAVGTNDTLLVADSAQTDGLKWAKVADAMVLAGSNLSKLSAVTGAPNGTKYLRDDGSWQTPPGGGGGNVGTDVIWDVKGDLAIGTGADTAVRQDVADSAQTSGVKWANVADGMVAAGQNLTKLSAVTGTPNGAKFLRDDGSWQGISSYGTTLPGSPIDGQQAILVDSVTNPTYQWQFRYNAGSSSAYKWEFIGGTPITAEVTGTDTSTSTTYTLLANGPSVVLPRAGDWLVEIEAVISNTNAGTTNYLNAGDSAIAANIVLSPAFSQPSPANYWNSVHLKGIARGLGAITLYAKVLTNGGTASYQARRLIVQPVRV
jgi:hypothetical protein